MEPGISAVVLVLITLCSALSVWRFLRRFIKMRKSLDRPKAARYEDEDGIATEESKTAYSYRLQRVLVVLLSLSGLGSLDSLALAVIANQSNLAIEQWLHFIAWLFLILQAGTLFVEPDYLSRFRQSAFGATSSFLFFTALFADRLIFWPHGTPLTLSYIPPILNAVQLVVALGITITYCSIPRRPDVYRDGKIVDQQYTTSILGRLGFSWSGPVIRFVAAKNGLEVEDLPEIHYQIRSRTLRERFDQVSKNRLWKSLLWSHNSAFVSQLIFVTITSFATFLPQIALYFILQALETRDGGDRNSTFWLWIWVSILGLSIVISSWLEAWLFFVSYSRLGQPIFQQLTAVIFGKAMRRKDVKGVAKSTLKAVDADKGILVDEELGTKGEDSIKVTESEDHEEKTRQSTTNLIGVDSYRVSSFVTFIHMFPGGVVKLVLAFVFLIKLIGWIPLLAGLAVPAIMVPVNGFLSKHYAKAQEELMKFRDKRMAVVTEALQGIRQIKFSALEDSWQCKILDVRRKELKTQRRVFKYDNILVAIWLLGPVMLSAIALGTYAIIHGSLSPSTAFTTISVFEVLDMTLVVIPELISQYLDAKVSIERVEKYLNAAEKKAYIKAGSTISFHNADIAWPAEHEQDQNRFFLRRLNIDFPSNELSIISGKTGSGKSLLLASILGEADLKNGAIQVPRAPRADERFDDHANASNWYLEGSLAFVAQIPWIENTTIKNNILFGLPFDSVRYKKTLAACALQKDLEMLPDGEMTEVGANGINLSGGQKWRVSFARALYSRASILILDDIFSAVDVNVGRQLFEEALIGDLGQGRTRVLVSHHVALCISKTKYLVLLDNGSALYTGTVDELRENGGLKSILAQDGEEQQKQREETQTRIASKIDDSEVVPSLPLNQSRRESNITKQKYARPQTAKAPKNFVQKETREKGAIKYRIYAEYIRASGGFLHWILILTIFTLSLIVTLGRSWWISVWTRSYHTTTASILNSLYYQAHPQRLGELKMVQIDNNLWFYLSIYLAWSVASTIGASRYFLIFLGSIRASNDLFQQLTYRVLRAPLHWLDTVPLGRILNRFTADFNMVDSRISIDLAFMLHSIIQLMSVIIAGMFVSPWMIIFIFLLLPVCMHYAIRYLKGARDMKRIESNCKSPIFESFDAALMGIGTIRAFDKTEIYVRDIYRKIDTYAQAYWHLWLFNRWIGFRLNLIGAVFVMITAAFIVTIRHIDAAVAGFALSFALEYTVVFIWALRRYASVELNMNAVERIVEYSNISIEDQNGGEPAPAAWPTEGNLEVINLVTSYAPDLPPVLNKLSFSIKPNHRVGVVGRTGAGKSSLTLALLRILEAREGVILIDGLDISKLRLQDVRSRLGIVPQDPVLFSGTVRSNLDAFNQHTEEELRDALKRVHLIPDTIGDNYASSANPRETIHPSPTYHSPKIYLHLDSPISESGLNLSQGQRQLLCLARAIIQRPKILILDEATSAVDIETDALIQRSIREDFQDSTLIVVAHRLSTIADFDRILVLSDGRKVEWGEPAELMERRSEDTFRRDGEGEEEERGLFRRMVEESGEREMLEGMIRREGHEN